MKTFTFAFLIFGCLFSTSCKKGTVGAVYISAYVDLLIVNQQSENLLSPPSSINRDDIKVYYVVNGKPILYNDPNMDSPKGFHILKNKNGQEVLRLFMNIADEEFPLTLISFGDSDMNTIKSQYVRDGGSVVVTKIWYNDELKYSGAPSEEQTFTIVR